MAPRTGCALSISGERQHNVFTGINQRCQLSNLFDFFQRVTPGLRHGRVYIHQHHRLQCPWDKRPNFRDHQRSRIRMRHATAHDAAAVRRVHDRLHVHLQDTALHHANLKSLPAHFDPIPPMAYRKRASEIFALYCVSANRVSAAVTATSLCVTSTIELKPNLYRWLASERASRAIDTCCSATLICWINVTRSKKLSLTSNWTFCETTR